MKYYIFLLILSVVFSLETLAKQDGIAAFVNDDVITNQEFTERKKMIIHFNDVKSTNPEQEKLLDRSVLDNLIDDTLLVQQEKIMGISITDDDVDAAIRSIEERNKMSQGRMKTELAAHHIDVQAFRDKIKAELLKSKLVAETLGRSVIVSPSEIEAAVLAQNSKDADVSLKILTAKNNDDRTYNRMIDASKTIPRCSKIKAGLYASIGDWTNIDTKLSNLEPRIQEIVKDIAPGEHSDVLKIDDSLKIFAVCSKKLLNFTNDESHYVVNFLGNKKLLLKAKKFQEDLRKKAYIKIMI